MFLKMVGAFQIDKPLTEDQYRYLISFMTNRRIARNEAGLIRYYSRPIEMVNVDLPFGLEGEFYIGNEAQFVLYNHNGTFRAPYTHPSMWCPFKPASNCTDIIWNGYFTNFVPEWAEFFVEKFFLRWGYTLNGSVDLIGDRKITRVIAKANHIIAKDI